MTTATSEHRTGERQTAEQLAALLRDMPVLQPGHVWLAGAGPGDPAHLSLLAVSGLGQADVVVHDALVDTRALGFARADAQIVFAGKRGGKPSPKQADITAQLVALAQAGRRVLRLKGGDPFLFGRGGDEALALAASGVPVRIVPGLTAGLAGLAVSLIPATQRGVNQAIVLATGHGAEEPGAMDWAALARLGQPIVLYMGMARLPRLTALLLAGGLPADTPAAAIASATLPDERIAIADLGTIAVEARRAGIAAPAIVVIGGIVRVRAELLALARAARP